DRVQAALKTLAQPLSNSGIGGSDIEVSVDQDNVGRVALTEGGLLKRKQAAVQQSIEIVRRRVDETGVSEVSIQAQGADRILVQVPGRSDPTHLKNLIGKTAKLTFHMVNGNADPQHPPADSEVQPLETPQGGMTKM